MTQHRITPDVKEQIINRVKQGGVSIKQIAEEHGITDSAIYKWLGKSIDGSASILELTKLRRENDELLRLVGLMTLKLSEAQKKK
jgi:transposase-like protein